MKDELIKILPDLKQAVEQGIAYAGDLFNRAVSYYTILSIIGIVAGMLLLIATIVGIVKLYKYIKKEYALDEEPAALFLLFIIPIIISIVLLCVNIDAYLQLKFIPEIYILQLITN